MEADTLDYLTDKFASSVLARRIEKYYYTQGARHVRAWVEPFIHNGQKLYQVRSNLKFKPLM